MPGSKERARKRAREHHMRQQRARQERQRKIRRWTLTGTIIVLVAGLALGLSLSFLGGGTPKAAAKAKASASASATPSATPTPTASTVAEPAHSCTYTAASGSKPSLPAKTPDWQATYTATINTNRGPVVINLANSKATCTVNSFVHLAETNFWNSSQCHRVSDSDSLYMLQCGDPTAKASQALSCTSSVGSGGPGYTFNDENLTGAKYPAGTIAMANGGANTNGSQFFLVFQNTDLPASYTPFGTITSGLNILQTVAKAGTSCTYSGAGGGVPKDKVIINSVSIKKA
ncbi:MAG TPA: peptidylprolyl isomerase [Trebonia sp.]|jgi:peptidyl-prolyl cis-trans isomerase B (cyclophilin B)|nr:peptidylprolyl isomerase [Trebonia sp.]